MSDKSDWIKIYLHGCKDSPVRGFAREEYMPSYAPGVFFHTRCIVIGYRACNVPECAENMTERVRFWALYFQSQETSEVAEPPSPYETEVEMLNEYKAVDASAIRNGYYQYYYEDKGKLIGIVDTKKKAFLMADTLFRKRKQWIDEQRQAVNNIYNEMNIGTVDGLDELPFG